MSNKVIDTVLFAWQAGRKVKQASSGWLSGNAPCCYNRGESQDKRSRGGLLLSNDNQTFSYHCFNCNFKAGWTPGKLLSNQTKQLLRWLGVSESDITDLNLYTLKIKNENIVLENIKLNVEIIEKKLPDNSKLIKDWIQQGYDDEDLLNCVKYIFDRGFEFEWYPWYWTNTSGFKDRLIIPFFYNNKIVGYTARKIYNGKPKYLTDSQKGYIFNIDNQFNKKFTLLLEGPLDAISIDGMAVMSNEISDLQLSKLKTLNKEIIIVPDRDKAGSKLIKYALENNWSISVPPWEKEIKDVADAVKKYGRLYTLYTILHYKETNKIKIELIRKKLESYD